MNKGNRTQIIAFLIVSIIILFVPVFVGNAFLLNKFSRYLALGLATMALSLAWGHAGILNLGHATYLGIGAYSMAMHLKLKTTPIHTGADGLPDFMVWNNVKELPWFWDPFHSSAFTIIAGIGIPFLLASFLGWFMFRARISGVFVAIITLAMLVVLNLLFIDQQRFTGGFNGITDLEWLSIGSIEFDPYGKPFYFLTAGCLIVALFLTIIFTKSKTGLLLRAIRDEPERVRYFGYDVATYQIFAFAISAGLAGLAGMFYTMVLEFFSPTFMGVPLSLAMIIWCAVGGRESLLAATIGAILVNAVQGSLSETFLESWQLIIGGVFVLIVLLLPKGLVSIFNMFKRPVVAVKVSMQSPVTITEVSDDPA